MINGDSYKWVVAEAAKNPVWSAGSTYAMAVEVGAELTMMENRINLARFKDGYGPVGAWFLLFKAKATNAFSESYMETNKALLDDFPPYSQAKVAASCLRNHLMMKEMREGRGPIWMDTVGALGKLAETMTPREIKHLEAEAWEDFLDMCIGQAEVWAGVNTGARPRLAVLREQGVNGQLEMAGAFDRAGFECVDVHMSDVISGRLALAGFQGLAACGGFSYGDVLGAGGGWARAEFTDAAQLAAARPLVVLRYIETDRAVAARYPANRNGSPEGITGLTSADGRATILMLHPERLFRTVQHSWHPDHWGEDGPWLKLFRNAQRWEG